MSNESTKIIETMAAELEHLRPMEASLEMVEADVKAYKQRVADLEKEVARLQQYHDTEATKWLAENQKLKDKNSRLEHLTKRYETVIFFRMISENEHSSAYGTNGEDCIEDFASNITFCHIANKYWKLVKGGKTIAREAIYQGE